MAGSVEQRLSGGIPAMLSFADGAAARPLPVEGAWNVSTVCVHSLGTLLRNHCYLPLMKSSLTQEHVRNQRLAEGVTAILRNPESLCSKKLKAIRYFFFMREVDVRLEGCVERIFTVRLFESKMPIAGKKLRVILFCFNGNRERTAEGDLRSWNPLRIDEVSTAPLSVLRAFQSSGLRVDSLITNSLGNLIFDGLKFLPPEKSATQIIPRSVVIMRGFTSVKKVGDRLFPFPLNCVLYRAAQLSGWDGDAETGLLDFCKETAEESALSPHQVVIIEAKEDHYFSGEGALASDTHERIAHFGVPTFRARFWAFPFHSRSHHAIPVEHFTNNLETDQLCHTPGYFGLDSDEKVSSAIARNIFFSGDEKWHTSYCTAGADATLEIATVRDVIPLLSAFIKHQDEVAASSTS